MADHNYCDAENQGENVVELTEPSSCGNYEPKYVTSMSDNPNHVDNPRSGPLTRLKNKTKLEQSLSTWAPLRTAPGLRPNCTIFYDGNGFAYHNHKIANNKKYLKCTQKSIKNKPCPARAVIRNTDNMIRHSGEPHIHKPKNYDEELLKRNFLMRIRERAINESTPNRRIFDEEIKKTPKLRGKVSFSSTARRMQRFRQPQKIQGPLFPIEDNELIDAINDYKNIANDDFDYNKDCKTDTLLSNEFDAESQVEVIEVNENFMDSNYDDQNNDEEYSTNNDNKGTEKIVNMFCCVYCNKWQEAQLFEFVPNQTLKTIELKEEENTNMGLVLPFEDSNPVITPKNSENNKCIENENASLGYSEICEDISQNQADGDNKDSLKNNDNLSMDTDMSIPEPDSSVISKAFKGKEKTKKNRKTGLLQMRIDSTIYFDNMGYSYQIQNEKNDKKYLRCVVWGKKKCPGRAHLNKKTSNIIRSRGHNHLPSSNCDAEKQARAFLHAIKGRAQDEVTPLRTIYEEEIAKYPLADSVVNYSNATRRMQRTRRLKNQPSAKLQKDMPSLLSVQVIPGTRRGTSLYMDELGYYYHNDTLTNNGKVVRCTKNRKTATEEACYSRGFLRASGDGFVIYRTKDHNHPPGDLKRNPMERSFINTLCERARNDVHLNLKDIYNQEVEKFLDVADKIPYRMAWRSMARTRQPPKVSGEIKEVKVSVISELWEGYTLYKDAIGFLYSMRKGRKFVWCHLNTKLKCLVKGSISIKDGDTKLEFTGEHNHPPLDDDEFQAAIFIEKIMLRCLEDDSKPKKLYDEEIVNFPGVEKRVSLGYAREKIKARRKASIKKYSAHETIETTCEPLQFVELWDNDEENPNVDDYFTEDNIYSEDENEDNFADNVYLDEQGFKYSVVGVKNKTKHLQCVNEHKGCSASGDMFQNNGEWLFVQNLNFTHNHQPHGA